MALYLPLVTYQSLEGSCAGNFLSPTVKHIVVPDGHSLVFKQLESHLSSFKFPSVKMRVVAQGHIVKLYRIPVDTGLGLDVLAIYTRVYQGGSSKTPCDYIHFKQYDSENNEFVDLGVFSRETPGSLSGNSALAQISICNIPGPDFGTVVFSNGQSGKLHFINPLDPSNSTEYTPRDNQTVNSPGRSYWISNNTVCVVRETKYISALLFIRVSKNSGNNTKNGNFSLKQLSNSVKPQSERIACLASLSKSSKEGAVIVFPDSLTFLKIENNGVKEDETMAMNLTKTRGKMWWPFTRSSEDFPIFVSSSLESIQVEAKSNVRGLVFETVGYKLITPLGSEGYFLARPNNSSNIQVVRLEVVESEDKIITHNCDEVSLEFNDSKLMSHHFEENLGSEYWSSFRYSQTPDTLLKMQRFSKSQSYPAGLDINETITGVWLVNTNPENFFVSTADKSALYELTRVNNGMNLSPVEMPAWMDAEHRTISAAPGIQITDESVRFYDGNKKLQDIQISEPTAAFTDGTTCVLTSPNTLSISGKSSDDIELKLDDVIVDVALDGMKLLVLTSRSLFSYNIDLAGSKIVFDSVENFSAAATCVLPLPNNQTIVGFTDGSAYLMPEKRRLRLSTGSIQKLHLCSDSVVDNNLPTPKVLVLTSEGFGILDLQVGIVDNGQTGNFTHAAISNSSNVAVTVKNGRLEIIEINPHSEFSKSLVSLAGAFDTSSIKIPLSSGLYILDPVTRRVTVSSLKDNNATVCGPLPPIESGIDDQTSQLFVINENYILEVVHCPQPSDDSDGGQGSQDEDSEDENEGFVVSITTKLYRTEVAHDKGTIEINEVFSKSTSLLGDPFDEVIVKFITPTRFTVFTHSVECIPGLINLENQTIELGSSSEADMYVYDDHWLYDQKRNQVLVVDFSGSIYTASSDCLSLKKDPYPMPGSETSKISQDANDMVFDVALPHSGIDNKEDNNKATEAVEQRFAISVKKPNNNPISDLILLDYNLKTKEANRVASLSVPSRDVKLLDIDSKMRDFIQKKITESEYNYLRSLVPEVVAGTSNGSVYMITSVRDEQLLSALKTVQKQLLDDFDFVESQYQLMDASKSSGSIDGALLIEALRIPELHGLFVENGVDPVKLLLALTTLTY